MCVYVNDEVYKFELKNEGSYYLDISIIKNKNNSPFSINESSAIGNDNYSIHETPTYIDINSNNPIQHSNFVTVNRNMNSITEKFTFCTIGNISPADHWLAID